MKLPKSCVVYFLCTINFVSAQYSHGISRRDARLLTRSDARSNTLLRRMNPTRSGRSGNTGDSSRSQRQSSQSSVFGRLSKANGYDSEASQSRKRKKSGSGADAARLRKLQSTGDSTEKRPPENDRAQSQGQLRVKSLTAKFEALQAYTSSKSTDTWQSLRRVPSTSSFQRPAKSAKLQEVPYGDQIIGIPPDLPRVKTKGDWTNGAYRKLVKENWGDYSEGAMLREDSDWNPKSQ